jgi:hypothetical protein
MKLGIFGDSFAHVGGNHKCGWSTDFDWPTKLAKMMNISADFNANGGTSIFWSYEQFLAHYKNYSHIVFVYTYPDRYPILPEELGCMHWLYAHSNQISNFNFEKSELETFKSIAEASKFLFNSRLLRLISNSVITNVNKICKENNIELVNVMLDPLEVHNIDKKDLSFSTIENLAKVSSNERVNINGKLLSFSGIIKSGKLECRECHLLEENNKVLAENISRLFGKNIFLSAPDDIKDWVTTDNKMDECYRKLYGFQ